MNVAWMFPGQGSQAPGMGRQLVADYQIARDVLQQASALYGDDLDEIRRRGPAQRLAQPDVAELLIATMQISYASILMDAHLVPDMIAGYSAGEVGAYFASGVLTRDDALYAAAMRGKTLCKWTTDNSRMISVTRIAASRVEQILNQVEPSVEISAFNSDHHVSLVGEQAAISVVAKILAREGATISTIDVAGPWHSQSIVQAAREIEASLQTIPFTAPRVKLYLSATGQSEIDGQALRRHLAHQVALPVLWGSILSDWKKAGVTQLIEIGSGRHLQGILRTAWTDESAYQVECLETPSGKLTPLIRLLSACDEKQFVDTGSCEPGELFPRVTNSSSSRV